MILENKNQFPEKYYVERKREREKKGREEVREEVREEGSGFGSGHAAAYELLLRNAIIKLCS